MADRSLGFNISTSQDLTRACEAMVASLERLNKTVDKLDGKVARLTVKADTKGADAGLDNTERKRKELDGKTARVKVEIDKKQLTDTINSFGMLTRNMQAIALPAGIALATPTIMALGQAAFTASQSLLLLPAAGAAAGAILGTVKLATVGLGAAFKALGKGDVEAFNKALEKLSPNARAFVLAVRDVKPAFDSMRMDVQNAAFKYLDGTVRDLATTYLPVLRTGLVGIAQPLQEAAATTGAWIASSQSVAAVQVIFSNVRDALFELNAVGADAVQIFLDIAAVGSDFLPGLAAGFAEVADKAAEFVTRARETGQLHDWISQGLSMLGLLAQTLINVGATIVNVFKAANLGGEGFATKLRDITAAIREWTGTAEGQAKIAQIFNALRDAAAGLMPLIGAIALAVLGMVATLGPAIPPLVKGLTDVFNASGPLMGLWGDLAAVVLPLLGAALSTLAPVLGPLLAAILAITTAMKIYSVTVGLVKLVTEAWAAAQVILDAVLAANPIGIVVIALAALAAALIFAYNHSETFRNLVQAAWAGIQAAASTAWAILQGIFSGISAAMSAVGSGISGFGQAFIDLWQNYIVPAWNGIVEAIRFAVTLILTVIFAPLLIAINYLIPGGMNGLLVIMQSTWASITAVVSAAWAAISAAWTAMVNYIAGAMTAAQNAFHAVVAAVWAAINAVIALAWSIISPIWNAMVSYLGGPMSSGFRAFLAVAQAVWNSLYQAIQAGWNLIRDNVWNPLVHFITVTIPDGFRTGVAAVRAVWDGIRAALRDPVQAAINVVWNNGIVKVWNTVAGLVGLGTRLSPVFLASGGPITGGVPGRDSVPLVGMPGEYMLSKRAVDNMGGPAAADAFHRSLGGGAPGTPRTVGGRFAMAGGGPVPPGDPMSMLGGIGSYGGSSQWGSAIGSLLGKLASAAVDWLRGKITAWLATIVATPAGPGGSFTGAGASFSSAIGGGGAMQWIIAHESGGNPRAQNPTSSASGLFQMIDGTWRAYGGTTAHAKDASVAEQQAVASRYVASRYGSWENAQRFWMAHHYYDQGGYLMPGSTMATNTTGKPERILDPVQTKVWDVLSAARPRGHDGGELLGVMRALNANIVALRGDVDHHGDNAAIAGRLDLTNRLLAGAVSGTAAGSAQTHRTIGELGPF